MIYTCDNCHFLFSDSSTPEFCPDCGKQEIRTATPEEENEFQLRSSEDVWEEKKS